MFGVNSTIICKFFDILNDMDENKPKVMTYLDFKKYLNDIYQYLKSTEKKISHSYVCRQMGLPNTRSYFKDIISGRTPLSMGKLDRLSSLFSLEGNEAQYFRLLVQYNQTTIISEKDFCFEQIIGLTKVNYGKISTHQYEYFKNWIPSVVRASLDVYNVKTNIDILVKNITPPVSKKRIKESFDLLKKLKFIELKNGFWKPSNKSIYTSDYILEELIRRHQAECGSNGIKAVLKSPEKRENFSSNTISLSTKAYDKLERSLKKFKREMSAIIQNDDLPATEVYQLNLQLFPHNK